MVVGCTLMPKPRHGVTPLHRLASTAKPAGAKEAGRRFLSMLWHFQRPLRRGRCQFLPGLLVQRDVSVWAAWTLRQHVQLLHLSKFSEPLGGRTYTSVWEGFLFLSLRICSIRENSQPIFLQDYWLLTESDHLRSLVARQTHLLRTENP
jgi:hypothetical protein